jgi:tetratricopeptide (TPR) repeat protein
MSTESNNSNEFREQGNQAFKQGHFQEAIDRYTDAINILTNLQLSDIIENDLTKCYSNRSQCYINLGQYDDAIEDATRGRKNLFELFFVFEK